MRRERCAFFPTRRHGRTSGPPRRTGPSVRHGEITFDGKRLETARWGPAPDAAPTLVLLHEGLGCVALWRDFPEALVAATGCGVFAWSRFGYGGSDPVQLPRPMTYMHDEALKVLPRVLDAAGVRRAVLVGHSDGGSIAAIHAGAVQDSRVAGIVLIAAHFFVEDLNIASITAIKANYEQGDLRQRLARYHRDVDVAFRGWNDAWLDPGFRQWDITEALAYIRVPILIVQGEDDQYGTVRQIEVAQEECYCPVEVALLPKTRHAPHREAPEATLLAVTAFADRLLRDHREAAPAGLART
jgi:pimeloyl-ACP methyl ester carboxylesterase